MEIVGYELEIIFRVIKVIEMVCSKLIRIFIGFTLPQPFRNIIPPAKLHSRDPYHTPRLTFTIIDLIEMPDYQRMIVLILIDVNLIEANNTRRLPSLNYLLHEPIRHKLDTFHNQKRKNRSYNGSVHLYTWTYKIG